MLTPASVHARRVELSCITESLYSTGTVEVSGLLQKTDDTIHNNNVNSNNTSVC